jgi:cobalt-precorrin-5B (C1)-methyltransferase
MSNRPVGCHSDAGWRKRNLRQGYTTGACAAASSAAATRALLTGQPVTEVVIDLPAKTNVEFPVARCAFKADGVTCGTIKDAGDDPDVTHGAEVQATVVWIDTPGIHITGGRGVGQVTLPGLAVDVGQPAINPAPRRQIRRAVIAQIVAHEAEDQLEARGLQVTISVPGGEALAKETMNPRLGVVGGISILGTTGVVKPYSKSAYRASIYIELNVAAENGVRRAVLTTGRRSEEYALAYHPGWTKLGCVQVGDHIGYALRQAKRLDFEQVVISGMVGKLSKLAQGRMQTHVSRGKIDFDFLTELVAGLGAGPDLVERVRTANTARHVQTILRQAEMNGLETSITRLAAERAFDYVERAFPVQVLLFDIGGELLAEYVAPQPGPVRRGVAR